jgi:uncharacterized protein (DUF58 family)
MSKKFFAQFRQRINAWVLRDLKPEHGNITLQRRRIYILPTRAGLLLAAALAAMLVASINYQLSLGFLFTFLIGAIAIVAMHRTHDTLLGLQVTCLDTRPAHAGGKAVYVLRLTNVHKHVRGGLRIQFDEDVKAQREVWLGPSQTFDLNLDVPATRRGWLACPRLKISTVYPFGLWHSWSYFWPAAKALVYPALVKDAAPPSGHGQGQGAARPGATQEAFSHVTPYQDGQDVRMLYWRGFARGVLAIRQHEGESGDERVYRLDALPPQLNIEERLARLATALVRADIGGDRFGLVLGNETPLVDRGATHRHTCLSRLATFGMPA